MASRCSRIGSGGVAARVVILDSGKSNWEQEEEHCANYTNRESLCRDHHRRSTICSECRSVADLAHLADLSKVEGASESVRHAEASLRLYPANRCTGKRQRNKQSNWIAGCCANEQERRTKRDRGNEANEGDATSARDLIGSDVAYARSVG